MFSFYFFFFAYFFFFFTPTLYDYNQEESVEKLEKNM